VEFQQPRVRSLRAGQPQGFHRIKTVDLLVGQVVNSQQSARGSWQMAATVPLLAVKNCGDCACIMSVNHIHRPIQQPGQQQRGLGVQAGALQTVLKAGTIGSGVNAAIVEQRRALHQIDFHGR